MLSCVNPLYKRNDTVGKCVVSTTKTTAGTTPTGASMQRRVKGCVLVPFQNL
jgi:hypothetical protein